MMKVQDAIKQIESCGFECEGGLLKNNVAWQHLRKLLMDGPEYLPTQEIVYPVTLKAESGGYSVTNEYPFYIAGVIADSTSERRIWKYTIAAQLPSGYYGGADWRKNIREEDIKLPVKRHD